MNPPDTTHPSLTDWTIATRAEPLIRVGIVLPADRLPTLQVRIPDAPHRIDGLASPEQVRGGQVELRADSDVVSLHVGARPIGAAARLRLEPCDPSPLVRGQGLQLFGVVAGRGFHWERRIDPTFCGAFEFHAAGSHLLAINELPLETYLAGVIAAEMSGDCPLEFLRSQCIVARSWVLAHTEDKHSSHGIDRCNDDCCQRYQGTLDITPTVIDAVRSTRGQIILDESQQRIIDANYSKNCGGIIESPEHVWNVRKAGQRPAIDAPPASSARRFFPLREADLEEYLTGDWLRQADVFCSPAVVPERDLPRYLGKVDDGGGHFRWTIRYSRDQLEEVLRRKFFSSRPADPLGTLTDLTVVARGDSGRAKQLRIDYRDPAGHSRSIDVHTEYAIRDALHPSFLYSSAFVVRIQRDDAGLPTTIELIGAGWGHGAGLCQIGALGMALQGHTAEAILHHYFSPIHIRSCY